MLYTSVHDSVLYTVYSILQYIILMYGILKLNSTVLPSSEGYISQYTPKGVYRLIVNEINEGINWIIILNNDILSVQGLNSDILYLYCDKGRDIPWNIAWAHRNSQRQSLRNFLRAQTIFHRVSQLKSQYRHSQLQFQYCLSLESNIGIVDYPYCSGSWGYIFQYTSSSTGSVLENIPPALLVVYFPVHSQ